MCRFSAGFPPSLWTRQHWRGAFPHVIPTRLYAFTLFLPALRARLDSHKRTIAYAIRTDHGLRNTGLAIESRHTPPHLRIGQKAGMGAALNRGALPQTDIVVFKRVQPDIAGRPQRGHAMARKERPAEHVHLLLAVLAGGNLHERHVAAAAPDYDCLREERG